MSGQEFSRWPKAASRWRQPEFISNLSSLVLTGAFAFGFYLALPENLNSAPNSPPAQEISLSLLDPAPGEPTPDTAPQSPPHDVEAKSQDTEEKQPEAPPPEAKAEPITPDGVLPPPKPRKQVVHPKPKEEDDDDEDEAPKPRKKIVVEPRPHRDGPVVARHGGGGAGAAHASAAPRSTGSAAAFHACLAAHKHYPTGKDAMLQKPHGVVTLGVSISGGSIVSVSVVGSSGSSLLDQAARSGVLGSGCGAVAGGASSITGRISY